MAWILLCLFGCFSNSKLTLMKPGKLDIWFEMPLLEKSRLLTMGKMPYVYFEPVVIPNEFLELLYVPTVCCINNWLPLAWYLCAAPPLLHPDLFIPILVEAVLGAVGPPLVTELAAVFKVMFYFEII